jgi:hypothetical protein
MTFVDHEHWIQLLTTAERTLGERVARFVPSVHLTVSEGKTWLIVDEYDVDYPLRYLDRLAADLVVHAQSSLELEAANSLRGRLREEKKESIRLKAQEVQAWEATFKERTMRGRP